VGGERFQQWEMRTEHDQSASSRIARREAALPAGQSI
jgi:hypothetical protein